MAVYPERRKGRLTGKWIAEITRDGVRIARKSFDTKRDGETWEGYMKLTGAAPPTAEPEPTGISLKQAATEFLATKPEGSDPSGRARLLYAVDFLGTDKPIAKLDTTELDKLVRDLKKRKGPKGEHLTPGTINRYLSAVSSVLHYARERKHIATSPTVPWQEDDGKRLHWLTEPQEAAVMAFLEAQGWAASVLTTRVLVQTGIRWGEFAGLTTEQIEPETGWIRLWRTKNGEARSAPIEPSLARELKRAVADGALPNYYTYRKHLQDASKSAGLPVGFSIHALRHTTATRLIAKGVPLPIVQLYLGHKTVITTMKYAHVADNQLQEALKKLSPHAGETVESPELAPV